MTAYRKRRAKPWRPAVRRWNPRRLFLYVGIALGFALIGALASLGGGGGGDRVATFRITGRPSAVVADADRVWIADDGRSVVHVLQAKSGREPDEPISTDRNPVALAMGDEALWVAHATGAISRIDPITGTRRALLAGRSITDVVFASGSLWAADLGTGELLRIDVRRLRVVQRIAGVRPVRVAAAANRIWVTTQNDTLVAFSPTGKRVATVKTGAGPIGLAADGRRIWVANSDDGTVTRVDARAAKVIGRPIAVGHGPVAIAVGKDDVWVVNQDDRSVMRIDRRTARAIGTPTQLESSVRDVAASGTSAWVVGTDPSRAVRLSE